MPTFIAALFTMANIWKHSKHPTWVNKLWSVYVMEYYQVTRKYEMLPFTRNCMEWGCHVKQNKAELQILYNHSYVVYKNQGKKM